MFSRFFSRLQKCFCFRSRIAFILLLCSLFLSFPVGIAYGFFFLTGTNRLAEEWCSAGLILCLLLDGVSFLLEVFSLKK